MIKRVHMVGTCIAVLVLGVALAPYRAAAADYAVQPSFGPGGTRFAFFATGFTAGERVSYWTNSPDGTVVDSGSSAVTAAGNG